MIRPSTCRTYVLPVIGSGNIPRIATAGDVPTRVMVSQLQIGGVGQVYISLQAESLQQVTPGTIAGDFVIGPGIFVLSPGQALFAAVDAAGAATTPPLAVSVAQSDAFPLQIKNG